MGGATAAGREVGGAQASRMVGCAGTQLRGHNPSWGRPFEAERRAGWRRRRRHRRAAGTACRTPCAPARHAHPLLLHLTANPAPMQVDRPANVVSASAHVSSDDRKGMAASWIGRSAGAGSALGPGGALARGLRSRAVCSPVLQPLPPPKHLADSRTFMESRGRAQRAALGARTSHCAQLAQQAWAAALAVPPRRARSFLVLRGRPPSA